MKYPIAVVPETITVRPALACRLSGFTPFELQNLADPDEPGGPVPIRAVRTPGGTTYRLDDLFLVTGAMADSGLLPLPEEDPPF